MRITVYRRWLFDNESIGKMYINRIFSGIYTLEDRVRPFGEKIAGKTAIPYGVYEIDITYSPKFGVVMPLILNVPGFSGIRIHTGNDSQDTEGCLLVGLNRTEKGISKSSDAYKILFERIKEAKAKGEKVTIEFISTDVRIFRVVLSIAVALGIIAIVYIVFSDDTKRK